MSHERTTATLFSGFEGFGVGARAAGYRHLWGVEWSARIAGVADRNGFTSIVADVRNVDYAALERPYHLHGSPVCKNASIAKTDRGEAPEDLATADAVCRAIEALRPVVFTLENVRGYLHFESFKRIVATLKRCGYGVTYDILNSADYGVPQTRERLILRAVQGQDRPLLPIATHARRDKLTPLFDDRLPWVGWLEAIADLIDTLPASEFAPWQMKRLPGEVRRSLLIGGANTSDEQAAPYVDVSLCDEPSRTVAASGAPARWRALVMDGEQSPALRSDSEPLFTVGANQHKQPARAWLMRSDNSQQEITPERQVRPDDEPSPTIRASTTMPKALQSGRVVKMTPRALARFQTFPDTYWLPGQASLACEGIGNAVPCLLAQRLCEVE